MKILFIVLLATFSLSHTGYGQNYLTKNGKISFFSKTSMENIDAVNNQVLSVLNTKSGEMAFSVLVRGFLFKKALMQEHFNENYMESDKFPKATFKGNIEEAAKVNFAKNGEYPVTVSGDLSIHGVTKKVSVPGKVTVKDGKISAFSEFNVLLKDYDITVPKLVQNNISPNIKITIDCNYLPKN